MLISFNDKHFKLAKFPPLIGRELMTKGQGCKGLLNKGLDSWIPIFSFITVRIGENHWLPLSTVAMVENHVPEKHIEDLLLLQLQHNCSQIKQLLESPTIADVFWHELQEVFEEVFA